MTRCAGRTVLALAGALVGALAVATCAGCREARGSLRIVVFASASLTAPMESIASDYERAHPGVSVDLHCAGTPHLLVQARQGASVDVFVSADRDCMDRFAASRELLEPPRLLARNALAIAVPAGNRNEITGLADLERGDLVVALCGEQVPAGAYAREALERAGAKVRSRSDEPSVKALVTKVQLGELDAGIVYASDLRDARGVEGVPIPPEHNIGVEVVIAPVARGSRGAEARRFVAWALGERGRAALEAGGFAAP